MDLQIYEQIIEARGKDAAKKGWLNRRPLAKQKLRSDLIKGKGVWTNDKKQDFISYLRLNHELISVIFAPPEHPFGNVHRLLICASHLCISLFFSAFATVFLDDAGLIARISYSIYCSICTSLAINFTKCCLVCQCVDNAPPFCRNCVKCCGAQFVAGMICYSVFLLGVGILMIELAEDQTTRYFLFIFVLSTLQSYLIGVLIAAILFELQWRKEQKMAEEGELKKKLKYYITFKEYLEFKENGVAVATVYDDDDAEDIMDRAGGGLAGGLAGASQAIVMTQDDEDKDKDKGATTPAGDDSGKQKKYKNKTKDLASPLMGDYKEV